MEKQSLFQSFFKTLYGQTIIIELKNNVVMKGQIESCDLYFNTKLVDIEVLNRSAFPQLPKITSAFVRGSSIRYVHLPLEVVDLDKLHKDTKEYNLNLRNKANEQ